MQRHTPMRYSEEKDNGDPMYNNPTPVVAVGTVGTLAFTGANTLWWAMAGFALIAAGGALSRIAPKRNGS